MPKRSRLVLISDSWGFPTFHSPDSVWRWNRRGTSEIGNSSVFRRWLYYWKFQNNFCFLMFLRQWNSEIWTCLRPDFRQLKSGHSNFGRRLDHFINIFFFENDLAKLCPTKLDNWVHSSADNWTQKSCPKFKVMLQKYISSYTKVRNQLHTQIRIRLLSDKQKYCQHPKSELVRFSDIQLLSQFQTVQYSDTVQNPNKNVPFSNTF